MGEKIISDLRRCSWLKPCVDTDSKMNIGFLDFDHKKEKCKQSECRYDWLQNMGNVATAPAASFPDTNKKRKEKP